VIWRPPSEARIHATADIGEEHELHLRAIWTRGLRATYLQPGEPATIEDLQIGRVQSDGTIRWEDAEEDNLAGSNLDEWQAEQVRRAIEEAVEAALEPPED
jgi:hypothetical protein